MNQIEFLVEEPSMAEILRAILPRVLPEGWKLNSNCFIRTHEGKQDLQRSIPRKIRAMKRIPGGVGFVIIQDQDSNDCRELKNRLVALCNSALSEGESVSYCVRIVCRELEAWYLGDMQALEQVFPGFHASRYQNKSLFRNPDNCVNPKRELKRIVGDYPQIEIARRIGPLLNPETNSSRSFQIFLSGIQRMINGDSC